MRVTVELPNMKSLEGLEERYLQEAFVAMLYNLGKISAREGREALRLSRREFEEMLPHYGATILRDDPATVRNELSV